MSKPTFAGIGLSCFGAKAPSLLEGASSDSESTELEDNSARFVSSTYAEYRNTLVNHKPATKFGFRQVPRELLARGSVSNFRTLRALVQKGRDHLVDIRSEEVHVDTILRRPGRTSLPRQETLAFKFGVLRNEAQE